MSRGKELIKNTGILLIAKVSTLFVNFLLLPMYTSLLSTDEYGFADVCISLVMIVVPFLTLQLEMGLFRFFITEEDLRCRKEIVTTAFLIVFIILTAASLVYWSIISFIVLKYKAYIYFYYLTITLSTVLQQFCRACGNNKAYGMSAFIGSSLSVALNVVFIAFLKMSIDGILLSSIIAQSVSCIYMTFVTGVYNFFNKKLFSKKRAGLLLNYSLPMVFNQISSWAMNYSDRIIIINALGMNINGVYSVACKFSSAVNAFFNVYNIAWTENVIRSLKDEDNNAYINKIFKLTFNVYFIIITMIVNILPFVFNFLVKGTDYRLSYGHIPILLLGVLFSGMSACIGSIYIAFNKTKNLSFTTFLAGVINVIIHLSLLKWIGLYAASLSTLVSFVMLFICRLVYVQRFIKVKIKIRNIMFPFFVYFVAWVAYSLNNIIFIILGLFINILFGVYMIYENRDYISSLLKNVKKTNKV